MTVIYDARDQELANLAEQEREVEDALTRVGQGMGTAEDEAILRCALGLPARSTEQRHD